MADEAVETVLLKDLKKDPRNARKRTERSSGLIKESMGRFGAARSIVIDEHGQLIAGHGTVEAARAQGIKHVHVVEEDGSILVAVRRSGLSEAEKAALAIADNRSSDTSDWDGAMLRVLSEEMDMAPWFEKDELETLWVREEAEQTEADPKEYWDKMPEFEHDDETYKRIIVHFADEAGVEAFFKLIEQEYTDKTRYIHFPPKDDVEPEYINEPN